MNKKRAKRPRRTMRNSVSQKPAVRRNTKPVRRRVASKRTLRKVAKRKQTIRRPAPRPRRAVPSKPATVLVTGATGKQGGAVARALLKKGLSVRALTRKPESAAAVELKKAGAEIRQGSFENKASLEQTLAGAEIVFAMSTPFEGGPETETTQGIALADAAKEAGVRHFVFTSVASADKGTGVPHFDSKFKVEEHLSRIGIPFTIIAPVFFMENLVSPWSLPALKEGKWTFGLPASRRLQQIAVADIASFAALVMEKRDAFLGRRIDIASDELTGAEAAGILSRVSGRTIEYIQQPMEQIRAMSEDFARMVEWFDRVGYRADIPMLRKSHPQISWHSFEAWAEGQDWNRLLI